MKKIVFTGGHHTSALSVALELKKQGYEIYWLGHKFSMWGDKNPSAEYKEVTEAGIRFYSLKAGKFHRTYHPFKLFLIPLGFINAYLLLRKIKPDLIVSFGSYLAVPTVIAGFFLNIPSITHEQTSAAVISNQVISKFVKKIFVTFRSSLKFFPKEKTEFIGLPLSDKLMTEHARAVTNSTMMDESIFITGGKQGSHVINEAVFPIVTQLIKDFYVIHQTGSSTLFNDFQKALKIRRRINRRKQSRYQVVDYLKSDDYIQAILKSSLIVGRSGAHTVYQVGLAGTPSLWIPIPTRTKNEQQLNAEVLHQAGSSEILPEKDLSPKNLKRMVKLMMQNINVYKINAIKAKSLFPLDAKEKMVSEIKQLLSET